MGDKDTLCKFLLNRKVVFFSFCAGDWMDQTLALNILGMFLDCVLSSLLLLYSKKPSHSGSIDSFFVSWFSSQFCSELWTSTSHRPLWLHLLPSFLLVIVSHLSIYSVDFHLCLALPSSEDLGAEVCSALQLKEPNPYPTEIWNQIFQFPPGSNSGLHWTTFYVNISLFLFSRSGECGNCNQVLECALPLYPPPFYFLI